MRHEQVEPVTGINLTPGGPAIVTGCNVVAAPTTDWATEYFTDSRRLAKALRHARKFLSSTECHCARYDGEPCLACVMDDALAKHEKLMDRDE